MSTMEHLFMQIFDRKRSIEDQFKHQVESYRESLASNLLADGRRPPSWLWTSGLDDPSRPDPKDWDREQLICEILDPLPRVTTPANNSSLFILPTLGGKNVNLFNSNNFFTGAHASNKYLEARDESVSNDISERRRRNSETVAEPSPYKRYYEGGQLSLTETSGTQHEEPDIPPSKKAKISRYSVKESAPEEFIGRVTRSTSICPSSHPIKDSKASSSRSMVCEHHSTGQPSQLANPGNDVLSEPSTSIDYHAPNSFVGPAAHVVDNGCPSTNSISSRLSAITLLSEPDRIAACGPNERSVPAFKMGNHRRTSEIPMLHADGANILSCPDSSHDRQLNENVSDALKTTGRVEPVDINLTEGPGNEMHHVEDLQHNSCLRCHDHQPSSTRNSCTDFELNYFPGHPSELQVGSRNMLIDNLQKPTPDTHCSRKTELSESHLDIFSIDGQCDLNRNSVDSSVKESHNGLEVKLDTSLKDGFVSGNTMIEENNLRRWKTMPEDVVDTVQTVLESDEVERVSNRGPEEGVKLHGRNSECVIQLSYAKENWIFGNGFSNLSLDREGPLSSSMDSSSHTSEAGDSSRKEAYRSPIQEQEECCGRPKEEFLDVAFPENSESCYPVEKVHLHLREIKENDSTGKRIDRTNIVPDYDESEGSDLVGTGDRECHSPVCNGHASLSAVFLSKENASACSSPDPGIMLDHMKGLSVQSNLMQENDNAKLLEIPMQYSEGGKGMEEPGTKRKASSPEQADVCEGPVSYSSEIHELSGFEETHDSAEESSQRSTVMYIVSPGPSQSQNVILEGKTCVEGLGVVNDKVIPDARSVCNSVLEARYFLRSSASRDKKDISLESSRIDGSNNLKKLVDLCDITWPKRKYKGRANHALATSPRLRPKTHKQIVGIMEYSCREILNDASVSRADYQPFMSSHETEVALPEASILCLEEEHPSKKRRIIEADHDREGKCKAVGTPLSIRHVNKLGLDLADEDSNMVTESSVLDLEQSPALQDMEGSFTRLHHRSFKESAGLGQMTATVGIPNTHLHGLEETEFEGFSVNLPSVIEDEIINCSEIPSLSKERASLLQQLARSESMLTAKSCPSFKFNIEKILDTHHSLPGDTLEKLNLSNTSHATDMDLEESISAEDGETSDPFCSLGSDFDVSLLRSHPYKLSCSNAKYAWEAGKLPLTPPVQKLQQRTMSGKSVASSEERGSNPELVCFRIDENSSTTEESSEQGVGLKGVQTSANRVALADVTSLYQNFPSSVQNLPSSVSLCEKYLERGSLDSTNTMPQMETDHKENGNLSASHSSIHRSANPSRFQLNKGDASRQANKRKVGGTPVSGKWHKPNNIASNISSFIPLVREKQQTAAPAKRDIKVKALEVAEAAKRLQEKRQYEREMRKAAAKLERVRLEQENTQMLELKQKQKEESRRKKEADLEARKRQREVERMGKERKRRCTEEGRKQQRAHFEKSCIGKGHKEFQDKNTNDKKRKGKELPKEAKKQAQLEKGREIAVNRKTAEIEMNISKVVSEHSGHANSGGKAHSVLLRENNFDKMVNDSYALQNTIQDRMSVTTEIQDTQSYEISPYKDSDDEDGCEEHMRAKKCIPSWARRESLQHLLLSKRHLDPTKIFSRKRSFDLNEVLPRAQRQPLS